MQDKETACFLPRLLIDKDKEDKLRHKLDEIVEHYKRLEHYTQYSQVNRYKKQIYCN